MVNERGLRFSDFHLNGKHNTDALNLGVRGGVDRANGSCWDAWQEVFWFGALYKSLTCKRESHANCSSLNHNRPKVRAQNSTNAKWFGIEMVILIFFLIQLWCLQFGKCS